MVGTCSKGTMLVAGFIDYWWSAAIIPTDPARSLLYQMCERPLDLPNTLWVARP